MWVSAGRGGLDLQGAGEWMKSEAGGLGSDGHYKIPFGQNGFLAGGDGGGARGGGRQICP